jgi:glycosyltransferase involved in cell wall biosynthesis
VLTLAEQLRRRGYEVGVLTSGGPWVDKVQAKGVRVHVHPSYNQNFQRSARALLSVIHRHHYDILHVHDSSGQKLAYQFSKIHRIRIIMTVHGLYGARSRLRDCARISDSIIAVSPQVAHYITHTCGIPQTKVNVIPNGVATEVFHPSVRARLRRKYGIPQQAFVVGYAGRFTADKLQLGQRICKVLRDYAEQHSDVYVLVAGRNSSAVVSRWKRMIVVGHMSDMRQFYNACNLVVGTGRVALESLVCGVPTVAIGTLLNIGLITPTNLAHASQHNFGDHASRRSAWSNTQLQQVIRHVRSNPGQVRNQTLKMRPLLLMRFSADHMVRRITRLYRQASGP